MLPASTFAEITSNLAALHLEPGTAAQILAAVFAPLLRGSDPDPVPKIRAGRPRVKSRSAPRRKQKNAKRRPRSSAARERARAAIAAHPDATLARVAKLAKCGYGTVVNARKDLATENRKAARKKARQSREASKPANPPDPRERAQRFLRERLARGPQRIGDLEEAASKAHIDGRMLEQARADLGVLVSCRNTGVQAVTWSLRAP